MNESNDEFRKVDYVLQYKKRKVKIVLYSFLLLINLIMFIPDFCIIINRLVFYKLDFVMFPLYVLFLISLLLIFIFSREIRSYFGNKIIISDAAITIKRAALGKTYIISKSCILGKRAIESRGNKWIMIYLKNGKKISTGRLNCGHTVFENVYDEFKLEEVENIKTPVYADDNIDMDKEELVIRRNYLFPILSYFMLSIFIMGVLLLSSGFNYKYGSQDDFHISGTILSKGIQKGKVEQYKIIVLEDKSTKEYSINVNSKVYKEFVLNSKISIRGKRGSLGILYNINFLKRNTKQ